MEPVEPQGSGGLSSGLIVALVVAGVGALGVAGFFVFQAVGGSETTTTTVVAAPTTTTTVATTTTAPATTTTTEPEEDPNPFVGWWKATDADDSHLDLRVGGDGTFMYWDSASGSCQSRDLGHSPETWSGTAAFQLEDAPTLTASGSRTCFPYGGDNADIGENTADFLYDQETDMLEFSLDGVRYTRSPLPPEPGDSNPFVGSWEATDSDGTRVTMTIASNGTWESEDTRSGGCENMGLTYATWSATGVGTFDLDGGPLFEVLTTTFCHPTDGDPVPRSEDVVFLYEYRPDTDEVALLLFLETIFTRVP